MKVPSQISNTLTIEKACEVLAGGHLVIRKMVYKEERTHLGFGEVEQETFFKNAQKTDFVLNLGIKTVKDLIHENIFHSGYDVIDF